MNDLCVNYINYMNKKYSFLNILYIFYGSNIYNSSSSDLDVCLVVKEISPVLKVKMIKDTITFHKMNFLRVDEEIPFDNKLVYTFDEVDTFLSHNPFFIDGKIFISDVKKDPIFLASREMKIRLLLNILTTDHRFYGNYDLQFLEEMECRAWEIIIESVMAFNHLEEYDVDMILQSLYSNHYTGSNGEMYLGYKKNYVQKEMYLIRKIQDYILRKEKNCGRSLTKHKSLFS